MVTAKRIIILGVVLLLAGAATLGWGLIEERKDERLFNQIKSQLEKLDEVTADEMDIRVLAELFTGENWQQKLNEYNLQRQNTSLVIDTAAVFVLAGSAILVCWFLVLASRFVFHRLFSFGHTEVPEEKEQDHRVISEEQNQQKAHEKEQPLKDKKDFQKGKKQSEVLISSGWLDFDAGTDDCDDNKESVSTHTSLKSGAYYDNEPGASPQDVNVLLCDEKAAGMKKSSKLKAEKLYHRYALPRAESIFPDTDKDMIKFEKVLKAQRKSLEKQLNEFRQMAGVLRQAAVDRSQPFGDNIKELMQQVSAIRDYALGQQDRIKKLQEGYDWCIIKTFGLKVIRCIDNLEDRIKRMSSEGLDVGELEEIKDELIFALESSGIEQYRPEIDSEYSGQEKIAEAVKEKAHAKSPDLKGKIAQVVRAGYRHFIDDKNFKIVRTARVKLFG